jgi:hypothetical protein
MTHTRFLLAALALVISGCSMLPWGGSSYVSSSNLPPYEGAGRTGRPATEKELLLARADFSVEVARLTDSRRPRSLEHEAPDQIIYEYEPDNLIQSLVYRGPVLLNKFLAYRPKSAKHYLVEVDVLRLDSYIAKGKFMNGGHDGRYVTALEFEALVRRPDSQIVLRRTYTLKQDLPRKSHDGRHASKELDRATMYDVVEDGFRRLAENLAWDIRQTDARTWKINPASLVPAIPVETTPAPGTIPVLLKEVPQAEPTGQQNLWDYYGNSPLPESDPVSGSVLIPTQG